MKLLLDTHVLIWSVGQPEKLPQRVVDALLDPGNDVYVSSVSAWEIALKQRLGKLDFDREFIGEFDASVRAIGFEPLGLNSAEMIKGAEIESPHKDPFDRLLAGQAIVRQLTVVTADHALGTLGPDTLWD